MLSPKTVAESKEEFGADGSSLAATDAFLQSEQEYVERGLRRGFDIFVDRLDIHCKQNEAIIKDDEINEIFSTYKVIYNANSDLLQSLMKVRMNRQLELRDNLGEIMAKFIPYLKLYIDYIVKKQECYAKLNQLRKSNKKFSKFLLINEACARRKIKSFLDEPVKRLPQYLQQMANIYIKWEQEDLGSLDSATPKKQLFDAISSVRKVTEEISQKVKNKKARRLLGILQNKIFNNKIALIASHRLVVHYDKEYLLNTSHNELELCHFILCNDIFVIAKTKSKANANALYHVLPLIALKVERDPIIPEKIKNNKDDLSSFGITGILGDTVKQMIVFCQSDEDRINWVHIIEDSVEEETNSLHPCNPVDLEKRLRKEKCSPDGTAEVLNVTNPATLKKIQNWKQNKASGKGKGAISKARSMTNLSPKPRGKKPPPRKVGDRGSTHKQGAVPPSSRKPGNKPPPGHGKGPPPSGKAPPPRKGGPPPASHKGGPPPSRKPAGKRASILGAISGFDKRDGLKKIDITTPHRASHTDDEKSEDAPQDMGDLLVSTLATYRQYVMDDEDDDDDDDDDWND